MKPEINLLDLVTEHWDSIRENLEDEQYELLLTRLRELADTPQDDSKAVKKTRQGVRLALLRLPLSHPVRLAVDSLRLVATPVRPPTVAGARELLAWLASAPPVPDTAAIIATAQRRLLQAPSLSSDEVRARFGQGTPPPELIRLADPHRGERYPEFQFTAREGTPFEVVLEVNRLLLADIDPWGAAEWWLSANTWLGGAPASFLGRLPDRQLVGVAASLVEGDR